MMFKSKSTSSLLPESHSRVYPADSSQYELLEDCGVGVSATVNRARCIPFNEIVAIKRCNLDLTDADLQVVIEEVAIMRHYQHPAVLPLLCSFVAESELWMVMPYMEGGSVAHVMRYAHPDGLEEVTIATIAKEVLRGLEYVHKQGGIHRDVKAGNILLGGDGTVRLGDFGVSATQERRGSWGHSLVGRKTLAGTPCWMAPEVLEESGYNDRCDIWSFGITLLEMAHGSAPFAKMPPLKVLMMTLQNPPPQLEQRVGQRNFSKSMREVVSLCLQKEPAKRPSARQLLEHRFFRQARDKAYLAKHLLAGLPPLTERVRQLRAGHGGRMPLQQARHHDIKSMASYVSSVMGWDFNLPAAHAVTAVSAPPSTASASAGSIASISATTAASGATSPGGYASSASEDGGARRLAAPLTAMSMPPPGPFGGTHVSPPAAARSPASPGSPPSQALPQHHVQLPAGPPTGPRGVLQRAPVSPTTPAEVTPGFTRDHWRPEVNGTPPVRASPFSPTPAVQLNAHFNHPPVANGSLVRGAFAEANKQAAAASGGGGDGGGGALGGPEGTAAAAVAAGPSSLHFSTSAPDLQHRRPLPAPPVGSGGPTAAGGAEATAADHGGDAAGAAGSQRRNQRHVSFAQLPQLSEAEAVAAVGGGGEHGMQLYGSGGSVGAGGSVSPQGSGGGHYTCMPQRRGRFQVVFETITHHPEPRPGQLRAQTVPAHAPAPLPGPQAPLQPHPSTPGSTPGEQLVHQRSLERQMAHQAPHTPPTSPGAASPGSYPPTAAQPHGRPPLAPNRQRSCEPSRSPKTEGGSTALPSSAAPAAIAPLSPAASATHTPSQASGLAKQMPGGSALSTPPTATPSVKQHQPQQQYTSQPLVPPLPYPYGAVRTADGASLYGVWADMTLRSILAAVRDAAASEQLSLLLTSAVSSCHVPVVQLPACPTGAAAELGALTGTQRAPSPVLLRPLLGDAGMNLPALWPERVHQKQQQQEKQQQRRDLLLQEQDGLDSPRKRERDQQRPTAPSPGHSTASRLQHDHQQQGSGAGKAGRPVSPVRRLFIPSLYPPMYAEGGGQSSDSQDSSPSGSEHGGPQGAARTSMRAAGGSSGASDGQRHGSNDGAGNGTGSSGGYGDLAKYGHCQPGLVVLEVDERHPDFVALADAYCGGGGGGERGRGAGGGTAGSGQEEGVWARTVRLLGPLLRRLPREVERKKHRVAGGQGQGQGQGVGRVSQGSGSGLGALYQSSNGSSSSSISQAGRHDSSGSLAGGGAGMLPGPASPPAPLASPSLRERGSPPPSDLAQAPPQGGLVGSRPRMSASCPGMSPAAPQARPATPGTTSSRPDHVAASVGSTDMSGFFGSMHGDLARSPGSSSVGSPASSSPSSSPAPPLPGAAGKEGAARGEAGRAHSPATGVAGRAPGVVAAGAGSAVGRPVTRGRFVVVSETR